MEGLGCSGAPGSVHIGWLEGVVHPQEQLSSVKMTNVLLSN
jgi:hypothetical protein